jgi:beta-lactamase class A
MKDGRPDGAHDWRRWNELNPRPRGSSRPGPAHPPVVESERPAVLRRSKPSARARDERPTSRGAGRRLLALILLPLLAGYLFAQGPDPETPRAALVEAEIARIASEVPGMVGVAAIHLESRRLLAYNGTERFPMASVYKVPIAVQALTRVEKGDLDLDKTTLAVQPEDYRPGSGHLSEIFRSPGVTLSLRHLIRLSLIKSDNTAADLVLRFAGGPKAVTKRVRQLGIVDMRIDRSTLQMLLAWDGLEGAIADDAFSWAEYETLTSTVSLDAKKRAVAMASVDVRDTTTPTAMARLLEKIWRGEALEHDERDFLLETMEESNGSRRLRGMLPPGLGRPAHKTGTMWGGGYSTVNDAGIIELPDGAGHLAVAVFINQAEDDVIDLENVIAQIGRLLVDFFILVPTE